MRCRDLEGRRREIGERKRLEIAWCKMKALPNLCLAKDECQKPLLLSLNKA